MDQSFILWSQPKWTERSATLKVTTSVKEIYLIGILKFTRILRKIFESSKVCLELGHCNVIDKKTLMRHQLVQDRNQNLILISRQRCQCPSTYDWYSFDMLFSLFFPYFFPLLNLVRSLAKMYVIHNLGTGICNGKSVIF